MLFSNKIFAFKWIFLNLYCSYIFISFLSSVIFESSFEVFIPFPTVWNLTRLMQAYHDFVIGMRFSKGLKMLGCYTIYCHWNAIWLPCKTSICSATSTTRVHNLSTPHIYRNLLDLAWLNSFLNLWVFKKIGKLLPAGCWSTEAITGGFLLY